jgi:hypothetical protein
VSADARGWRIALLPEALTNASADARTASAGPTPAPVRTPAPDPAEGQPGSLDVLRVLEECGYGLLQLPPPGKHSLLLAVIADQVAEYAHHGYAVVAVGMRGAGGRDAGEHGDALHWRRLAPLLRHRGVALPPRHFIRSDGDGAAERERLTAFLSSYDLSEEQQRRWRGSGAPA